LARTIHSDWERDVLVREDLQASFPVLADIGGGILKCKDTLPKATYFYYVRTGDRQRNGQDFLVVSENFEDDAFASAILSSLHDAEVGSKLRFCAVPGNRYGFSKLLLAPPEFHAYFKGRLDEKRKALILCLPVHESEFSGNESVDEFFLMRRNLIPTLDWRRDVCPKISLRFDNPKTRGGTGDSYVLVKFSTVLKEIENLRDVAKGFIEILNYKKLALEILSRGGDAYCLIKDRDDAGRELLEKDVLVPRVWRFLTE
jgi:hypothetical protein